MCDGCEVITTVSQPQTLLAGVAEPSENASRIIQLDDGFSLMLGVATPKAAI